MAIDFTKPVTTDSYSTLLQYVRDNSIALCQMLNETLAITGYPTDAVRWNKTNARFEIFNGASWGVLAARLMMDVDTLDGQQGAFYQDASNLNAGILPAARFNDTAHGNRAGGALHAAVTTTTNGFMLATDKVKLNGIESGATADQTAVEIRTLLLTVDGSGSGVDADLLDGQQGAYYAPITSPNFAGIPTINGNHIKYRYGFVKLHLTANNTIGSRISQSVMANLVERADTHGLYNLSTGVYTPGISGWYKFTIGSSIQSMPVGWIAQFSVVVGAGTVIGTYGGVFSSSSQSTSEIYCCCGDVTIYITAGSSVYMYIGTGSGAILRSNSQFSIEFLHP